MLYLSTFSKLIRTYMTCLAQILSSKTKKPLVTDLSDYFMKNDLKTPDAQQDNAQHALATILIRDYAPDSSNLSFEKILEFRKDYMGERQIFFDAIMRLTADIENIDSKEHLDDLVNHYKNLISIEVQKTEQRMKLYKLEPLARLVSISVPISVASFTDYVPPNYKVPFVVGGVLTGAAIEYYCYKKDEANRDNAPYRYLISLGDLN